MMTGDPTRPQGIFEICVFVVVPILRPVFQPENILLHCAGSYPRILIADFGLARPNSCEKTFNVCGTVSYLPPEGILALDNKDLGYVGWGTFFFSYIL
jgi:serine/threonine protein kinase